MDEIEKIWNYLKTATDKEKKAVIDKLDIKALEALRKKASPYGKPLFKSKENICANISFINTQEDYQRNLMMTAIVGFMYKMAEEFKHSSCEDLPSEFDGELGKEIAKMKRYNGIIKPEAFYKERFDKSGKIIDKLIWLRSREKLFENFIEMNKNEYDSLKEKILTNKSEELAKAFEELSEKIKDFEKEKDYCFKLSLNLQKENNIENHQIIVQPIHLDDLDNEKITQICKKKLNILKTKEEKEAEIQDFIIDFLDYHFLYDPNNHIRAGYMPFYDKVLREKIRKNPEKFKYTEDGKMVITSKFEEYLVPPIDTFASFRNYFENNYEYIRQCTDDIHGKLNLFECAIIIHETFPTSEGADKWIKKYESEIQASIRKLSMNEWTFLDSFKENRDKIVGKDEKDKLVRAIIEKNEKDEKLAKELMKKRGKKVPGRAPGLSLGSNELDSFGVEKVEELADEKNSSEKELEIRVFSSKLKKIGKRFKHVQEEFKFNIEAENPEKVISLMKN